MLTSVKMSHLSHIAVPPSPDALILDTNQNKCSRDDRQAGESNGPTCENEGHVRENKQSRTQSTTVVRLSSPPANVQLSSPSPNNPLTPLQSPHIPSSAPSSEWPSSTPIQLAIEPSSTMLHELINIITAHHNPKINPTLSSQIAPSMSVGAETSPLPANNATADLQRQLITTWCNKRVKELGEQGESLNIIFYCVDTYACQRSCD